MHIGFFVFPDFQLLDLSGPLAAFQIAGFHQTTSPYSLSVLSLQGGPVKCSAGCVITTVPLSTVSLDTLIICGGYGIHTLSDSAVDLHALKTQAENVRRLGSVCSGAWLLAELGLLNGRRATTHWRHGLALQKSYPDVRVESDKIFLRDGHIWTSAGISCGIDLALAMIEADLGMERSRAVAQELVVYQRRPGGQSQFSPMLQMEPDSDRIRLALDYIHQHLTESLTVEHLASQACLSPRQFSRLFKHQTGESPAKAVERLRVEAARTLLESTHHSIASVAHLVGFPHPETMRRAFLRCLGLPPQTVKKYHQSA